MQPLNPWLLDRLDTPIGEASIVVDAHGYLRAIDWVEHEDRMHAFIARRYGAFVIRVTARAATSIRDVLQRYFDGDIAAIDTVRCDVTGTPFQRSVWNELRRIAAGTTISYGELARRIGSPSAVRAVGLANGRNPIPIVVPCHRVIGANGTLTGYGGGLDRKLWLLRHERALLL